MPRADWVIDLFPYATRGMYDYDDAKRARERFTEQTWVVADICASEPWPFADDQFDFSVCSQTLEDVRDPIRVCEQLVRVSKAGYIEVPAPVEDLTWGIHGPWVGWSHHHWICELEDGVLEFNMKPHLLCADGRHHPAGTCDVLSPEERVLQLWWDGSFGFKENVRVGAARLRRVARRICSIAPGRSHPSAGSGSAGADLRLVRGAYAAHARGQDSNRPGAGLDQEGTDE